MAKRARMLVPFKVFDCGLVSVHLAPSADAVLECHERHFQLNGISSDVTVEELDENNTTIDICMCPRCYPEQLERIVDYPIHWDFNLDLTSKILKREIINE